MSTGDKNLAFVELSVPFTDIFCSRRTSRRVDHLLAEPFAVGIKRIDEADAPIAFRADGGAIGFRII